MKKHIILLTLSFVTVFTSFAHYDPEIGSESSVSDQDKMSRYHNDIKRHDYFKPGWYIGGTVKVVSNVQDRTSEDGGTSDWTRRSFKVGPRFGYIFNRRWNLGLSLEYTSEKDETKQKYENNTEYFVKANSSSFDIIPHVTYSFVNLKRFSVAFEASVRCSFGKSKDERNTESVNTIEDYKNTYFGVGIKPVVYYHASKHIMFECGLDFLSVGAGWQTSKDKDTDVKIKNSHYGFNFDGNHIFNVGNLTFGAVYKF